MAEIPVTSENPPNMEQRMERLEGSFSQILELLKTVIPEKEVINDNSNGDDNDGGGPSIKTNGENPHKVVIVTESSGPEVKVREEEAKMMDKMEMLEEKMRALQGIDVYGKLDVQDFYLFPDIEIPAKFKVPDFEKFEGKTDPLIHLTMYTRSMAAHYNNEKLMIHCFQHSLAGGALTWLLQLDKKQIKSWRNLAELFIKQYQFVTDIAPDRFELQRMKKAETETFREYAQRWREKASQVQPPLNEKEIVRLFVKTLDGAYFEKLLGCVTNRFSDVVIAGEQVEDAIREGKLHGANNPHDKPKKPNFQKKEGEVHAVGTGNYPSKTISHHPVQQSSPYSLPPFYPYPYPSYPLNFHNPYQGGTSQVGNSAPPQVNNVSFPNQVPTFQNPPYQPRKERVKIDPVPIPYSDLYDTLLQQHLVAPEVPQPVSNPPPKWYNPAEACKYHMGAPGHSIEKCLTFKLRVQRLRDEGQLFFEEGEGKSTGTSIDKDPLLKH